MKSLKTEKAKLPATSKAAQFNFYQDVWSITKKIPRGRVTSYGAIANYLGAKSSARLVGWALNMSHHSGEKVPAHRVVNRNGMLSGKMHFATPTLMEELLLREKTLVQNNKVMDFEKKFWDPMIELSLG
ncbi:MAG: MGMT family protein [Bacteroidetes bacterium]|nr:MGMT family protein [Bacteroidota bacterium]